ncbi:hypothetical protein FXO38_17207 [Capsicum annuum]|uniref:Uncharacterized protein n=1 Tax=Capsicum annuum TaxID=4072 RepID=A0A2G2ZC87_CAPAN|nr:hypothetical protein FXO38_17207 [Capsicum annuum]KAF3658591.1 hypothetical protein FXO37_14358 [Capsicum annuum]PHT79521.1 hypothetical protein T459_17573 [Capsicum annuum]
MKVGKSQIFFYVNVNKLSYFEPIRFLKELGCATRSCTFYVRPPEKDFLLDIQSDGDIYKLSQSFKNEDIVEAYVCRVIDQLDRVDGSIDLLEYTNTNEESVIFFNKKGDKGIPEGDKLIKIIASIGEASSTGEAAIVDGDDELPILASNHSTKNSSNLDHKDLFVEDVGEFESDENEEDINLTA